MPTTATILTGFAGALTILALAVYLFGIPPEIKRKMEKAALKTMGENKASYVMKGTCIAKFLSWTWLTFKKTKSPRSQIPTNRTSRSLKALWVILVAELCKTQLAKRAENWRIRLLVP
jgi:hypothetical protein